MPKYKVKTSDGTFLIETDAPVESQEELQSLVDQQTHGGDKTRNYSLGEALVSGGKRLVPHTLETIYGMGKAILQPHKTIPSMLGTAAGAVQKMTNYAVPSLDTPANRQFYPEAEAAYQSEVEPYTDYESFKRMIAERPAKPLGDLAAFLGLGGSLAGKLGKAGIASKLKTAAGWVDPINAATKTGKAAARAMVPKSVPRGIMKSAMKVPAKKGLEGEKRIAEAMLKRKMSVTERDLTKGRAESYATGEKVRDIVDYATDQGMEIPTSKTLKPMKDVVKRFKRPLRTGGEDAKKIGKALKEINRRSGKTMTPSQILDAKQGISDINRAAYEAQSPVTAVDKAIDKAHGAGLRQALVDELPVDVLLKKQSELIQLNDAIESALIRSGNMPAITSGSGITGLMAGRVTKDPMVGASVSAGKSIFDRPGIKSKTANTLESIRTSKGSPYASHRANELARANRVQEAQEKGGIDTLEKILRFFKSGQDKPRPIDRMFNIGAGL